LSELPPLEELGNLVAPDETALLPELRAADESSLPHAVIEVARAQLSTESHHDAA
jgi:hypothetical protein